MHGCSSCWKLYTGVAVVWFCVWSGDGQYLSHAGPPSIPKHVQDAFDKKNYEQVLDQLAQVEREQGATPELYRLRVRTFLKLGNPKDALGEYDKLELSLKHDEVPLLREVALGFILVMVKDMREQMRGAAYTALKEVNSDEMVPYFEDGLSDGSSLVRLLAVEGLSRSEVGRRSTKLRTLLEDPAGHVKALTVKVVGRTGDPSFIPLMESATKDELTTVRIAAYGALIKLGRRDAWKQLREAAEAPNPEDRAQAIQVIADLKDERGVSLMAELLTYKQPSVRGAAARGLGHLGRKEARGQIERLLQDPVPAVRKSALASLVDLGSQESVQIITQVLNDGQVMVRAGAIAALLQLGQPYEVVGSTARALAQQSDSGARAFAAEALGRATKVNAPGAISLLTSLTADPLPGPKIVALRSLGHLGDRNLIPLMKDALHDTNDAVRATAAGALLHLLQQKR